MNQMIDRTTPPGVHALEGLRLPSVDRAALPNGVSLVTLNQGLQSVCRLSVVWPVGMADVDSPEALRLLRPMLLEGTSKHSGGVIAVLFEFNGAWIKVEAARHMTSVTIHFLNKTASEVLPLVAELISVPSFPDETYANIRQKEAAACEMARRKVATKASELLNDLMFGVGHPLAHHIVSDAIRNVPSDALIEMHQRLMRSTQPTVYLAGLVDSQLVSVVADTIGQLDFNVGAEGVVRRVNVPMFDNSGAKEVVLDEQALQTAVKLAIPTISRSHPEYDALRFSIFALGGYFGSRLMSNIREEKGYTYGITSSLSSLPEGAFINISCQADNRYVKGVLDEIELEIRKLASEGVLPKELDVVKNTAMSGMAAMLDSPFSIMDFYQMADLFDLRSDAYEHQVSELASLTSERVMECVSKYVLESPRLIALAGNPMLN